MNLKNTYIFIALVALSIATQLNCAAAGAPSSMTIQEAEHLLRLRPNKYAGANAKQHFDALKNNYEKNLKAKVVELSEAPENQKDQIRHEIDETNEDIRKITEAYKIINDKLTGAYFQQLTSKLTGTVPTTNRQQVAKTPLPPLSVKKIENILGINSNANAEPNVNDKKKQSIPSLSVKNAEIILDLKPNEYTVQNVNDRGEMSLNIFNENIKSMNQKIKNDINDPIVPAMRVVIKAIYNHMKDIRDAVTVLTVKLYRDSMNKQKKQQEQLLADQATAAREQEENATQQAQSQNETTQNDDDKAQ